MSRMRTHKTSKYFTISNQTAQDQNLSFASLGLLTYCLSMPENWEFNPKLLWKSRDSSRDKIYKSFDELIKTGHCIRIRKCRTDGKLRNLPVSIEYEIFDDIEDCKERVKELLKTEKYVEHTGNLDKFKKSLRRPEGWDTENQDTGIQYIIKETIEESNISTKETLPLSSPSKDEPVQSVPEISLRSEAEDSLQRELNKTSLSPKEKDRLRKEFEPPEILRAIEISKKQSIKKTLMALLLTILRNPKDWEESSNVEPLTVQDQKALQYNEILYKLDKKTAVENVENIKSNKLLKTHIRYKVGDKVVNETISLKDINCISEIEVSINRLESILREMKKQ